MRRFRELDWLWLFLLGWIAPIAFDATLGLKYWSSLLFWIVPVGVLAPRYLFHTDSGGRRRRAFLISAVSITGLGLVLDFVFGSRILRFDDRPDQYVKLITAPFLAEPIPIEEVLFYLLGPVTVLLIYVWNDEYFLEAYNASNSRQLNARGFKFVRFSAPALIWVLALLAIGVVARAQWSPDAGLIPLYYSFLIIVAVGPSIALFRSVVPYVNWRAFAVTSLYLILTSVIWEVVLALPRHWWGYKPAGMIGLWVGSLTLDVDWSLPIEAAIVWIVTPFSVILTYETIKMRQYVGQPSKAIYEPGEGDKT